MDSSIQIFVTDHATVQHHVGHNISRFNLISLSDAAKDLLQGESGHGKTRFFLHEDTEPSADPEAARTVCDWIKQYDLKASPESQFLTIQHIPTVDGHGPTFPQVVKLYSTMKAFRIARRRRGEGVRSAIRDYIHGPPLSFDEYAMIYEMLAFDDGLVKMIKNQTMYREVKGRGSPKKGQDGIWRAEAEPNKVELEKIEQYARSNGFWNEMLAIKIKIMANEGKGMQS